MVKSGFLTSTLMCGKAFKTASPTSQHISGDFKGKVLSARFASTLKVEAFLRTSLKYTGVVLRITSISFSTAAARS